MSLKNALDFAGGSSVALLAVALLAATPGMAAGRQLTAQDYARAERLLPYNTELLVDHDVRQVHWLDERRFWYIDHDAGGDHYRMMTAATAQVVPLFDQQKLAAALGKVVGKPVEA